MLVVSQGGRCTGRSVHKSRLEASKMDLHVLKHVGRWLVHLLAGIIAVAELSLSPARFLAKFFSMAFAFVEVCWCQQQLCSECVLLDIKECTASRIISKNLLHLANSVIVFYVAAILNFVAMGKIYLVCYTFLSLH